MSRFNAFQRYIAKLLAAMMLLTGLQCATANAAMVSTDQLIITQTQQWQRENIQDLLGKQEAIDSLTAMGVDYASVEQRVNNMTDQELQAFSQQVDDMQAGGSVVGVVVLIFVVLIVLDLLGTTNVFPAIKPININ